MGKQRKQQDRHDNSEYVSPSSRTSSRPAPPEVFADQLPAPAPPAGSLFRKLVRDGVDPAEAAEKAAKG